MFTFDSKHTRIRYKNRAQEQEKTFGAVNRRQFGGNYIPMISFHSQAPHVQGHFEIWKQVFTERRHFDERIAKRPEKGNNPNLRNLSTTMKKKQPTFD